MNNRFRERIEEEPELEEEEVAPKLKSKPKTEATESGNAFFKKLFTEGVVSKEAATEMLPFLIFISVLCMLYIANSHMAVKNIRNIDKLNKEVKELSWEYKSLKADLMFKSKLTEVAKKVDTLGIKELTEPPKKIVINSNEY
uniref:FtsL-like putative cell division protein n=1 Tax=Pedobacter schmidteae TaxID=2201271 RepID=UPI000EB2920D|nr:FtsL-like putative cell division protein [Pedobacter schmidteae]